MSESEATVDVVTGERSYEALWSIEHPGIKHETEYWGQ